MSEYLLFENLILIILAVFLGGIVKGSVGIGMSMFSVPIIALTLSKLIEIKNVIIGGA